MENVKLSQLKLGPNVRKTHKPEAIAEMADSIKAVGVLQNLLVRPAKKGYEVVFGGRRFKALQLLLKAGEITKDYEVRVDIRKLNDAEATQLGLIENLFRVGMEPLEEAEAFLSLVTAELSVADIVLKTGFSERTVMQRVTLAERLHPEVKNLLKAGELTLEQAQTLTLIDPDDQLGLLENWGSDFDPAALRQSLQHSLMTVANAIFDLEQYQGAVVEDLFGDAEAHFADQEQARALQIEALKALKARLEGQGFDPVHLTQQYSLPRWSYHPVGEGEGQGGALVNVHPNTWKVEVLEGVVPNQPTPPQTLSMPVSSSPSSAPEPESKPRPPLTRKGAALAKNLKTLALQRALVGERGGIQTALALAVLAMLGEAQVYLHNSRERSADDRNLLDPKARAVQQGFVSRLPKVRMGEGGLELGGIHADSLATFKALVELPREDLETLFVALLAGRVGSWNERYSQQPSTRDSSFAVGLAEHLGVRLTWKDVPPEFWQSFSKERVAQIVGDFNPAYAHIPFSSRKEAVGTLLELAKVKPEQSLPEELQFQSQPKGVQIVPKAVEEALAEEGELEAA